MLNTESLFSGVRLKKNYCLYVILNFFLFNNARKFNNFQYLFTPIHGNIIYRVKTVRN